MGGQMLCGRLAQALVALEQTRSGQSLQSTVAPLATVLRCQPTVSSLLRALEIHRANPSDFSPGFKSILLEHLFLLEKQLFGD